MWNAGRSASITACAASISNYLDEFVFRFNRRYSPKTAFLLSIGAKVSAITFNMLTKPDIQG